MHCPHNSGSLLRVMYATVFEKREKNLIFKYFGKKLKITYVRQRLLSAPFMRHRFFFFNRLYNAEAHSILKTAQQNQILYHLLISTYYFFNSILHTFSYSSIWQYSIVNVSVKRSNTMVTIYYEKTAQSKWIFQLYLLDPSE